MLLPTQQASGDFLTGFMRNMLEQIEERRTEEEEKTKGKKDTKDDDLLKAKIKSDEAQQSANAKINEHFFGALQNDQNRMAELISRFSDVLGVAQADGESATDFADRLQDALTMVGTAAKNYSDGSAIPIGLKTLKVSTEDLKAVLNNTFPEGEEPSSMTLYAARIVSAAGVSTSSETFYEDVVKALTDYRQTLANTVEDVEKQSGLTELGISAAQMIEAIRRPWGESAQAVTKAFDDQAAQDKTLTKDIAKAIQRLEDVADPKTVAELKVERTENDPTQVEDEETRQEREADIKAQEVFEKVEDVKKAQDAISESNEATAGSGETDPAADATEVIQALAASAEAIEQSEDGNETETAEEPSAVDDGDPATLSRDEQIAIVVEHTPEAAMQAAAEAANDIVAVSVDEIGIYEILKKQKEAA
ncbi:hypothetical protein LJR030_000083 [Rhizobium sp. LjRoot30]|uniref:hypothetical protein n=1 Tax=Rhizobium sp. LjRoot30 TaxID=3342320 RepID=UPI003ED151F5